MLAERVVLSAYSNNPLKTISNETKLGHAFQRFAWSNHFLHWLYLYLHFTILFCTLLDRFCIYGTFCTNEFFALTQFKLLPRIKRFYFYFFFFSFAVRCLSPSTTQNIDSVTVMFYLSHEWRWNVTVYLVRMIVQPGPWFAYNWTNCEWFNGG